MISQKNNLLIDIGNTRLKWGVGDFSGIQLGEPALNSDINRSALKLLWQHLHMPDNVGIACVGSHTILACVESVANELWPGITINQAKAQAEMCGVKNAYLQPDKLGVDRWLAMVSAYYKYQNSLCVVGCGTAVTVDMINAEGQHQGGLISPGLRLMKASLHQHTENLGFAEAGNYPFGLANDTEAAIHNGVLMALCGMIEHELINRGRTFKLILTGGDADIIASHLSTPGIIDTNLVLSGLSLSLTKTS